MNIDRIPSSGTPSILAGILTAAVDQTLTLPLHRFKVILQDDTTTRKPFTLFKETLKAQGAKSFFITLLPGIPARCFQWELRCLSERECKKIACRYTPDASPYTVNFIGGLAAGVFETTAMAPYEISKTRAQARGLSFSAVMSDTLKNEGCRGFFKGSAATYLKQASGTSLKCGLIPLVETALQYDKEGETTSWKNYAAGFAAGAASAYLTTPLDLIKTRIQTAIFYQNSPSLTISQAAAQIARQEGPLYRNFFRSALPRTLLSAHSTACTYFLYRTLERLFAQMGKREDC